MQRVFHLPSHLSYVSKLVSDAFAPVRSPSGTLLRVSDLLAAFDEKTQFATKLASSVVTLTHAAAEQVVARFAVKPSVVPHGFVMPPGVVAQRVDLAPGLLVFGALRPNRDLLGLVRAWRLLPAARLPLRVLLRSFGESDQNRYASELAEIAEIARVEPDLAVEMTDRMFSPSDLVNMCPRATVLVIPYRSITHSGQLELARDLGLIAVVSDVPTVRAQLSETTGNEHPCVWFPPTVLSNPIDFANYLEKVSEALNKPTPEWDAFAWYRMKEHENLLGLYGAVYNLSREQR